MSRLASVLRFAAASRTRLLASSSTVRFSTSVSRLAVTLDPKKPIGFKEFESYRKSREATLIDVRKPQELLEEGQIPDTTNIPMSELEKALRLSAEEFEQTYGVKKPQVDDPVVFFCKGGVRASEANDFARWLFKFKNTTFYSGWIDWKAKTEGSTDPGLEHPQPPSEPMDFQFFELYRRSGFITIIDVREPDELITDGKIPGTINVPKDKLEDALRMSPEQFKKVYGGTQPGPDDPLILLCRSGKRAAVARDQIKKSLDYTNVAIYSGINDWKEKFQE